MVTCTMSSTAAAILALVAGAMARATLQENCASEEFACDDGVQCVPNEAKCDGEADCWDYSDEEIRGCGFECADGSEYINKEYVCDKRMNCPDGSDETKDVCVNCTSEEFACATNNQCVPAENTCDGQGDCPDYSDEELPACGFECVDGSKYIRKSYLCDEYMDCPDGSDETKDVCGFECADGSKTVPKMYLCDGEMDCPDGSDEQLCGTTSCKFTEIGLTYISGHDEGGSFEEKSWSECMDRCCRDENCKSFEHRENEGINCNISYVTKDEVPNSFKSLEYSTGQWSYYEMEEELAGEGDRCGAGTVKHCGPGLYCTPRWKQDYGASTCKPKLKYY